MNKRKRIIIASLAAVLLAGLALGGYAARHLYTKHRGVMLTPSAEYPIAAIVPYLQNDPEWGGDTLGDSGTKLSSAGCLISSVASVMASLGVEVNPGSLNARLREIGGFEGGELIWYKLNEAYPEIDYKYSRIFTSGTIDEDLKNGLLPIVNVRYRGTGVTHWVVILGARDGEYMIHDPLNAEKTPIPLSTHGRVYAYRALFLTDAAYNGNEQQRANKAVYEEPIIYKGVYKNNGTNLDDKPQSFNITIDEELALKIGSIVLDSIGIPAKPGTQLSISEIEGEMYIVSRNNPNATDGDAYVYIDKNTGAILKCWVAWA